MNWLLSILFVLTCVSTQANTGWSYYSIPEDIKKRQSKEIAEGLKYIKLSRASSKEVREEIKEEFNVFCNNIYRRSIEEDNIRLEFIYYYLMILNNKDDFLSENKSRYLETAINFAKRVNKREYQVYFTSLMGVDLDARGLIDSSIDTLLSAKSINNGEFVYLQKIINYHLAYAYNTYFENDSITSNKIKRLLNENLELIDKNNSKEVDKIHLGLAENEKDYETCLELIDKELLTIEKESDKYYFSKCHKAKILFKMKRFEDAKKIAETHFKGNVNTNYSFLELLGNIARLENDIPKALEYYEQQFALANELEIFQSKYSSATKLEELYEEQKNYKLANYYFQEKTKVFNLLYKNRGIAYLKIFESENRKVQSTLKKKIAKEKENIRQQANYFFLFSFFLICCAGAFSFFLFRKEKKNMNFFFEKSLENEKKLSRYKEQERILEKANDSFVERNNNIQKLFLERVKMFKNRAVLFLKLEDILEKVKETKIIPEYESLINKNDIDANWKLINPSVGLPNKSFLKRISNEHPDLEGEELTFCLFLKLNLTDVNISELIGKDEKEVKIIKQKLIEKLGLVHETKSIQELFEKLEKDVKGYEKKQSLSMQFASKVWIIAFILILFNIQTVFANENLFTFPKLTEEASVIYKRGNNLLFKINSSKEDYSLRLKEYSNFIDSLNLEIENNKNIELKYIYFLNSISIYSSLNQYSEAMSFVNEALEFAVRNDNHEFLVTFLLSQGSLFKKLGLTTNAMAAFEEGRELCEKYDFLYFETLFNKEIILELEKYPNEGTVLMQLQELENRNEIFYTKYSNGNRMSIEHRLKLAIRENKPEIVLMYFDDLIDYLNCTSKYTFEVKLRKAQYLKSIKMYEKAKNYLKSTLDKLDNDVFKQKNEAEIYLELGKIAFEENKINNAQSYLRKAYKLFKELNLYLHQIEASKELISFYEKESNFKEIYFFQKEKERTEKKHENVVLKINKKADTNFFLINNQNLEKILEKQKSKLLDIKFNFLKISLILGVFLLGPVLFFYRKVLETKDKLIEEENKKNKLLGLLLENEKKLESRNVKVNIETEKYNKILKKNIKETGKGIALYEKLIEHQDEFEDKFLSERISTLSEKYKKGLNSEIIFSQFESNNSDFVDKLNSKHPDLSSTDIKYCFLLRLKFSLSDITILMEKKYEAIKVGTSRLKKKLKLKEKNISLKEYLEEL